MTILKASQDFTNDVKIFIYVIKQKFRKFITNNDIFQFNVIIIELIEQIFL